MAWDDVLRLARDAVPLVALAALPLVAYRSPKAWVEALSAVVAAGASLATGLLPLDDAVRQSERLLPVVVFLAAVLVVAECCRVEGLFEAVGARLARLTRPRASLALVFAVAALTTVALSLDATVVLLTPVVLAAALLSGVSARPGQLACVRLANSASLLLPVSNLTNLLALPALGLSLGRFALLMAPVWVVVLLVEYAALRWYCRADLEAPEGQNRRLDGPEPATRRARTANSTGGEGGAGFAVGVVGVMLAGFAVTSPIGVEPAWVAVMAALVLAGRVLARRASTPRAVVASAQPSFAVFVLGLGVVVATLSRGWLGAAVERLLPGGSALPALLLLAAVGAVLANLVNNLPATLLLVPLVAPAGVTALLALLVGVNVGSSMTWTGSLANLLWRRTLVASGSPPSSRDFHRLGLLASPAAVVLGVVVLAGWAHVVGRPG